MATNPNRPSYLQFKVTRAQRDAVRVQAALEGMTISEWCHKKMVPHLKRALRRAVKEIRS